MKFDITIADLALVDDETGEELLDFAKLIPDENQCICDGLEMYVKERQNKVNEAMWASFEAKKALAAQMAKNEVTYF